MKGERIDKNVPFYMGFYKYKDIGGVQPTPKPKPISVSKTLNSLDFNSMLDKKNVLRRNSSTRQIQDQKNKDFLNCNRVSEVYENSERRTLRSSVDIGRRSCISSMNINGRTSVIGTRPNLLSGCKMEGQTPRVNEMFLGSEAVLSEQDKLQFRRFFYSSNEPAYKSESVNQRVFTSKLQVDTLKPNVNQLTRVSSSNNLPETLIGSRTSLHYSSSQKKAKFHSTAVMDSDAISFSRLIGTSAKKTAYLNCTPTIEELVKDAIDETPNLTAIDIETSIIRKTHRTSENRFSALSSAKKSMSYVKLTMHIRKLVNCFDKLLLRKSVQNIRGFGNAIALSKKLGQVVKPAIYRSLAMPLRLVALRATKHKSFHKGFIQLHKIIRLEKSHTFSLLVTVAATSKLHSVALDRKLQYSNRLFQVLKVLAFNGKLVKLKHSQVFASFQKLRFYDPRVKSRVVSLRPSASFLLQLSHLLDNDYRGAKDFFKRIKRRAFVMRSLEIQLEKKTKVLASQAQLALNKLRIFARYKRLQYKNLLFKRHA